MSKTNLSDAIEKLENAGRSKTSEFKNILEKDYDEIKKALESLKPYLDDLRVEVEKEVKTQQKQVEEKMQQNPWVTIGLVGVFAFVLGWIFGNNKK